jgi:collagen triple helix repeat protein
MKRLRHPIRAIREPFGTAGLIVACVALVLALTGAAFAAAGLTGKQKKEVEKIAKKYAGKPGAAGAAGPAGPQGAAGANGKDGTQGAQGDKGAKGDTGSPGGPGSPGAAGKSAEVAQIATGTSQCEGLGGAEVFIEGDGAGPEVCNGKEGPKGDEGDPWTFGGTLPPGAVETGTWAFNRSVETFSTEVEGNKEEITVGDSEFIFVPISFPVPLSASLAKAKTHYSTDADFSTFCEGTVAAPIPLNSMELCVYQKDTEPVQGTTFAGIYKAANEVVNAEGNLVTPTGASRTGAVMAFNRPTESASGIGVFAVKG